MSDTSYMILALGVTSIIFIFIAVKLVFIIEDLKLENTKLRMTINLPK